MSKSVTVICGAVWTRRSITWLRNTKGQPMASPSTEPEDAAAESFSFDQGSSWDTVYDGRKFKRRVRTVTS